MMSLICQSVFMTDCCSCGIVVMWPRIVKLPASVLIFCHWIILYLCFFLLYPLSHSPLV